MTQMDGSAPSEHSPEIQHDIAGNGRGTKKITEFKYSPYFGRCYFFDLSVLPDKELDLITGHGGFFANSEQTINRAVEDARQPLAHTLITACHHAFQEEFSALSVDEIYHTELDISGFADPLSLLTQSKCLHTNPIVSNTSLYLIQLLRYVATINSSQLSQFSRKVDSSFGLIGFSTGMLAASVIASANSVPSLINFGAEAFRLAFWIGFRAQQYKHNTRSISTLPRPSSASWTLVTFGATRHEIEDAIQEFPSKSSARSKVYLTAVLNDTCVTVSGCPDDLAAFKADHLPSSTYSSKFAAIHALYHCSILSDVKAVITKDVRRRNIKFPSYSDLHLPLRSTVDGHIISAAQHDGTFAEEIIDMIFIHPINFDYVLKAIREDLSSRGHRIPLRIINLGPGMTLGRNVARALSDFKISLDDWSSASNNETEKSSVLPKSITQDLGPRQDPIAIVGMAVKFPGANNVDDLWRVLEKGLNTVSEIPKTRFDVSEYTSTTNDSGRSLHACYGNFIDNPFTFDNDFFHISPREARSMDPQQRLLLQISYHALENAGYVPDATETFNPDTFAAYVGVATNDYVQNLRNDVDVYYSTGTLQAFLSGKISYAFGFSGPSMVIDTACSSSIVAIHQACRALNNGDCNAALAGGVNVITSPDMHIGLDRAHFLSPTGQCKPWDASADGYCRSEGCGMFVLKRLSDAMAENDNILGVIRGIEVNQSGNAESITHPHSPTLVALFKKLLRSSGIESDKVSVVEAHGTGTRAGDPAELESIRNMFAKGHSAANPLHVTSIKANIGHAEAASGAASLAKLILMLRKGVIPATISLKRLNPRIPDLSQDHVRIDIKAAPWEIGSGEQPRIAVLNNFGASGSNAALVLEETPVQPQPTSGTANTPFYVIGFSCKTEQALEELRTAYLRLIQDSTHDSSFLTDFAYTSTARRQQYRYRIAISGNSKDELCANLKTAQVSHTRDVHPKVVFVFSGQGGQYLGMGSNLHQTVASFRRVVDECHNKLLDWGFSGILHIIDPNDEKHEETDWAAFQSAVFVLEYALAVLWMSWGVKPHAVVGHSLGEYAALVIANVLKLDDALKLVAERGRLMTRNCAVASTGMLAVSISYPKLAEILTTYNHLSIACYNSPTNYVLAGPCSQLQVLEESLRESGHRCSLVNIPFGYHSPAMAPILEELTSLASQVTVSPPTLSVLSDVRGSLVHAGNGSVFDAKYFARHCAEPVKFTQGIQHLLTEHDFTQGAAWIEIGPHATTLPMLRSIVESSQRQVFLPSMLRHVDDRKVLSSSLSELYCMPITVNWRRVFADFSPNTRLMDLPAYPFKKTEYRVPYAETLGKGPSHKPHKSFLPAFSLIGDCRSMPTFGDHSDAAVFETPMGTLSHLIEGHKVSGSCLCPASVYIELASAASHLVLAHLDNMDPGMTIIISDITFKNPLVYTSGVSPLILTQIGLEKSGSEGVKGTFQISSSSAESDAATRLHCAGKFNQHRRSTVISRLTTANTVAEQGKALIFSSPTLETIHSAELYEDIFSKIVAYSPSYRAIKSITFGPSTTDAYAIIQMPNNSVSGQYVVHPIFVDTLLHAAGFIVNRDVSDGFAFICSHVGEVNVVPDLLKSEKAYGLYLHVKFLSETLAVADSYAMELDATSGSTVVAHISGMQFRRVGLDAFGRVLSKSSSQPGIGTSRTSSKHQKYHKPDALNSSISSQSDVTLVDDSFHDGSLDDLTVTAKLKNIMTTMLGLMDREIDEDEDLLYLGLDSLMSIEVCHSLSSTFGVNVTEEILRACRNVRDLNNVIFKMTTSNTGPVPTPDMQQVEMNSNGSRRLSQALLKLRQVLSTMLQLPMNQLHGDVNLEHLGFDPLSSIEAWRSLCLTFNIKMPPVDAFSTCKTIEQLHELICAQFPSGDYCENTSKRSSMPGILEPEANPILFQGNEEVSSVPLFLIHDGSGTTHAYRRLSAVGRPVWAIHNPKFFSGEKWEGGITEMAVYYASLIQRKVCRGECIVGGWSIGGVIAFEVAQLLTQNGVHVAGLVLIDSPHPNTTSPLTDSMIHAVISAQGTTSISTELVRTQMRFSTQALVEYEPSQGSARMTRLTNAVMLCCYDGFSLESEPVSESATWLADRGDPSRLAQEWENVLKIPVPIFLIPGNHFELFHPEHISELSQQLKSALASFDHA